jgi:DNA-directed RNA polymerase subunit N (RpoN/RPB10)
MIIPIKCFTCGKVIADKYLHYLEEVRNSKQKKGIDENKVEYLTKTNTQKAPEGLVMDKLGLHKMCCRRHMLTHVDII